LARVKMSIPFVRPTTRPTTAERLDQAVSAVLDGAPVAVPPALAPELAAARTLRDGLRPVPPGARFEGALARRLDTAAQPPGNPVIGFWRHHHRLALTGAVGSVVVSTAGVAVVAWRFVHRAP
jgi:hypothetical protein